MFFFQIFKIILRCFLKDCKIILFSSIDFLINFNFLINLKKKLKKIQPKIENIHKNKKKILVDCYDNSLLYLYALALHTFPIQKNFNANCIIYSSNFSFTKSYLFSIFKNNKIVYLDSFFGNLFVVIKNFKTLKIEFKKIQKIENKFEYKFDGIEFGKISYDTYLRLQLYGTFKDLSKYRFYLFRSIIHYLNIKKTIEKKIFVYSGKETQFTPRAVVLQACLKNSIKSYIVWGPHNKFSVRKYSKFSQRYFSRNHINKHDFINKKSIENRDSGRMYIKDKYFSKGTNKFLDIQTTFAFGHNLKKLGKESFLNLLNLDINKKTAVIFAHCVYDGVFATPRKTFDDYYTWLEETALCLAKNNDINVIIKPHPTERFRTSFDSCKEIYEKNNLKEIKHIKLLKDEFHPTTILNVTDFCITANGTAGAEYAAFNIPCITTDYAPYNYCSFNHNFKNKDQYFFQLMKLPEISNKNELNYKNDAYNYLNISFKKTKSRNPYFAENKFLPSNMSIGEESKFLKKCINLIEESNEEDKRYFYEVYKNYFENNKFIMFNND